MSDERMPRRTSAPETEAEPPAAPASAPGPRAAPEPAALAPAAAPDPAPASASRESAPAERPAVESPSPDVELASEASPLPGVHRGGFLRLPTAPIAVTVQTAPAEPGTDEEDPVPTAQWLMPAADVPHRGLAGWALAFSLGGLIVSLFVGWGFPIGLVGVVSAILALRRPLESRAVAVWALVIGVFSILYSAGWLLYAAWRAGMLTG